MQLQGENFKQAVSLHSTLHPQRRNFKIKTDQDCQERKVTKHKLPYISHHIRPRQRIQTVELQITTHLPQPKLSMKETPLQAQIKTSPCFETLLQEEYMAEGNEQAQHLAPLQEPHINKCVLRLCLFLLALNPHPHHIYQITSTSIPARVHSQYLRVT